MTDLFSQKFSKYDKQYMFNDVSKELVELPDSLDIDEYVNSFKECAIDKVLDKFLNIPKYGVNYDNLPRDEDGNIDMSLVQSDLDELQDVSNLVSEIQGTYDLPSNYTIGQIYEYLTKVIKGGDDNEKISSPQTVEASVDENVQASSEESA